MSKPSSSSREPRLLLPHEIDSISSLYMNGNRKQRRQANKRIKEHMRAMKATRKSKFKQRKKGSR
jgi:hypothetical protein